MQAGKLRQRIQLQRRTAGSPQKTPSGQDDTSWQTYATTWAAIEPLRGREFMEAQGVQGDLTVRIRLRYRTDVRQGDRCLHGSTVYPVEAPPIDVNLRNRELHLMCSQGASNG